MIAALAALPFLLTIALVAALFAAGIRHSGGRIVAALLRTSRVSPPVPPRRAPLRLRVPAAARLQRPAYPLRAAA